MARVACMVMQKDERALLPRFIGYHAALFGAGNLYVFDNGSSDPAVLAELDRAESLGVKVERRFNTTKDFRQKGTVLGDLIKRLDRESPYDFYIPLDCDEFVALRTGTGFTADPTAIHAYLDRFRGDNRILHVTLNLSNVLGVPDTFRPAKYSKTVYPREIFLHMDHGYHTGVARDGSSPYFPCDLVYVHYHFRPYEEVVSFAKQKLRVELSDAEIEDHDRLREFRGMGWHMVHYIVGGAEAYYRQFRNGAGVERFAGIGARFAEIGIDAPFSTFLLPPPPDEPRSLPPHLIVDEASTARIRGWAIDRLNPEQPLFLRFRIDGAVVWEGLCDAPRPDVRASGQPSERVGFDFLPPSGAMKAGTRVLTVQDREGGALRMSVGGSAQHEAVLAMVHSTWDGPVYSHIDSLRHGWIQGWVLRTVTTPEGPRLLGRCTVALVHDGRTVVQAIADISRPDVAEAMKGEHWCGFRIEVPRALLGRNGTSVFRLFVMPEKQELTGSPCILAPNLVLADG